MSFDDKEAPTMMTSALPSSHTTSSGDFVQSEDFKSFSIQIFEPFSEFLRGSPEEHRFSLSLLDVIRFAGHACPSMVGAFLIARKATQDLYPESGVCVRGEIAIDVPGAATQGATGPMANVFGFITGAWSETGFGGLGGSQFVRRGLLRFSSPHAPQGGFRFTRLTDGTSVEVFYDPSRAPVSISQNEPFQLQWRRRIKAILDNADAVVWSHPHEGPAKES